MGTKAIRFTESELAALEQLVTAAGEAAPGNEELQALWLKVTGRKPAPKAKARKAPATVAPELIEGTLKALRAATSRAGGHYHLKRLKVIELRAVAKALEVGACSKLRKDELVDHLINFTVQMKLDHDAIRNGAMGT